MMAALIYNLVGWGSLIPGDCSHLYSIVTGTLLHQTPSTPPTQVVKKQGLYDDGRHYMLQYQAYMAQPGSPLLLTSLMHLFYDVSIW